VTAGIGDARTFLFAACPGAVPAVMVPKAEDPGRLAALSLTLPAGTGIIPPADPVTTDLTDESVLEADLKHAVTLGLTAKLCIHPGQVGPANRRLTPSGPEIDWARGVIAAGQDGAVGVRNSQMIDRPVVLRAEAILARAARTGAARTGARTGQEG